MFNSDLFSLFFVAFLLHYSLVFFCIFFFTSALLLLYYRNDNFLIVSIGLEVLYIVLAIFFCAHSIQLDDLFYFWLSFCCIVLGAIDTAISLSLFSAMKKYSYYNSITYKRSKVMKGSSGSVCFSRVPLDIDGIENLYKELDLKGLSDDDRIIYLYVIDFLKKNK